ncbi:hypothetical protein BaRGS_00011806 [Batillaria attramentaria]|uniref:Uncharacterized protein n=1 Tax=Batillaria attramentaria TaxID=370345 RepID=A0ABD0LB83_9CAEN
MDEDWCNTGDKSQDDQATPDCQLSKVTLYPQQLDLLNKWRNAMDKITDQLDLENMDEDWCNTGDKMTRLPQTASYQKWHSIPTR